MANTQIRKLQAGVPTGGTAGQALVKNTGTDFDYDWAAISGGGSGGTKLAIDTTQTLVGAGVAVDVFTINIPGGTLGTNDAVRFKVALDALFVDTAENLDVNIKYGGATLASIVFDGGVDQIPTNAAYVEGYIIADTATNAQKCIVSGVTVVDGSNPGNIPVTVSYGTGAIDSTVDQNLVIEISTTGQANSTATAEAIVVEKISDAAASSKKVGVGEISDIQWFNTQPLFGLVDPVSATADVWDIQDISGNLLRSPSAIIFDLSDYVSSSSNQDFFLPDFSTGTGYQFNSNQQLIVSATVNISAFAFNQGGFGFDIFGAIAANKIISASGTNTTSVGFIQTLGASQWYARCADGAGFTETAIAIANGIHTFRVEYDPGNATPQARFYVDGLLLATITTNVPSAVASLVAFTAGGDGASQCIQTLSAPSFAVEI